MKHIVPAKTLTSLLFYYE